MASKSSKKLTKPALIKRLKTIKLLTLDVDGVLTDGGLYFLDNGEHFKKFNVRDGVGIQRVMAAGVSIAIITASTAKSVMHRGQRLGVPHVFTDVKDKLNTTQGLCEDLGINILETAHIGDDLNDLPLLKSVGLSLTVADAVPEVIDTVDYVTKKAGGEGAVREISDLLIQAKA